MHARIIFIRVGDYCRAVAGDHRPSVIIILCCDAMNGGNSSGLKRSLLRVATDDGLSGQFLLAS